MWSHTKGFLCKTCAYRGTAQNGSPACSLHKKIVNPDIDFCSDHLNAAYAIPCQICQKNVKPSDLLIYQFGNSNLCICAQCAEHIGTCTTCINQNHCSFQTDRSEPHVVMRTVRQGMMTMQTQVKNPNLVQKHCMNCQCSYGQERDCLKDENGGNCANWQIIPELLQS